MQPSPKASVSTWYSSPHSMHSTVIVASSASMMCRALSHERHRPSFMSIIMSLTSKKWSSTFRNSTSYCRAKRCPSVAAFFGGFGQGVLAGDQSQCEIEVISHGRIGDDPRREPPAGEPGGQGGAVLMHVGPVLARIGAKHQIPRHLWVHRYTPFG